MEQFDAGNCVPRSEGFTHWDGPGLDAWQAWRPEECARVLDRFDSPWCVVGGWALDLSLGRLTREHEDLEIAIPRATFPAMRAYLEATGYVLHSVGDGEVRRLERDQSPPAARHQNWVLDPVGAWRMDVMLEPGDIATWVFRRDERLHAPRAFMVGTTQSGLPHLKAHGVLLYKAKAARAKDEADFNHAAPGLGFDERAWLTEALARIHPGHAWIKRLIAQGT